MTKHIEIKTIEHKGVAVSIKINYDKGEVSLVERDSKYDMSSKSWIDKHWLFANRGLEYINSWLNILESMSVAIKEAKKDLESNLAEKSKFEKEFINKTIKEIVKIKM